MLWKKKIEIAEKDNDDRSGSKEDKEDWCMRKIMHECGCGDNDNEIEVKLGKEF